LVIILESWPENAVAWTGSYKNLNMNWEDDFSLSRTWKCVIHFLKGRRQHAFSKN